MPEFTSFHRGGEGPPLVLLHGFTDTWRTWELVLPALERHHDVFAPTLPGHAGGPPVTNLDSDTMADGVERAMDAAGLATAHIAGNSLGGHVALQLAARGRARTVTALAPAGGWAADDDSHLGTLKYFTDMRELVLQAAPHAAAIMATDEGRRRSSSYITTNYRHIPAELLAHQLRGAAACDAAPEMVAFAGEHGWPLDAERIDCPVRVVWGTADRILEWPGAAARYRRDWLPHADWVELDGVGHCPQLDVPLETAQLILGFAS